MLCFSPSDVEFDDRDTSEPIPESMENIEEFNTFSMVNFLVANRSKLMQLCLDDNRNLGVDGFYTIFQSLIANDIATALKRSLRTTVLLVDILDINNKNTHLN